MEKETTKTQTHKKHLRGWLPREPKPLQLQITPHKPKNHYGVSAKLFGGLATGTLILGFFLLTGPYYLFPNLYVAKANAIWGYTTANSIAGWTFIAGGIGLVVFSLILFTVYAIKLRRGNSAWMNHNWITPRYTDTLGKKIYITTIAINIIMTGVFLFTISTSNQPLSAAITFSVLISIVNALMFGYYNKYRRYQKNEV